ncbi:hypothetical protein [Streptomyces huiliensis]|uniref:hypothetical protein n=1 Tax=Streptomyces huiliensis TaxID=2876027 RepID=UPI001CBB281E|nr:hypothetical protein [Streptomyces huiliensis]MBZ4319455.1 hypothetical protein [Streptomyces huiliensis]
MYTLTSGRHESDSSSQYSSVPPHWSVRKQRTTAQLSASGLPGGEDATPVASRPEQLLGHITRDTASGLVYVSRALAWDSFEYRANGQTASFTGNGAAYAAFHYSPLDRKLYAARAGTRGIDVYGAPVGGTRVGQGFTNYPINVKIDDADIGLPFLDIVAKPASGGGSTDGVAYVLAAVPAGVRVVAVQLGKAQPGTEPLAAPPTFHTPGCNHLALVDGQSQGSIVPGKYVYAFGCGDPNEKGRMFRINTAVPNGNLKEVSFEGAADWKSWGRPAFTANGKWVRYGYSPAAGAYGVFYGEVERPDVQAKFAKIEAFAAGTPLVGELGGQPWPVADGNTVYCVSYFNVYDLGNKYAPHTKEHQVRQATRIDLSGSTASLSTAPSDWDPAFPGGEVGWWVRVKLHAMAAWWKY